MSKTVETSATPAKGRGRDWSPSFKRTVKGFTMPNFDFKSVVIEGTLPNVPTDLQGAVTGLGLSAEEIVLSLKNTAKMKLVEEKTEAALGADAIPESVLYKFIEPYRAIPRIAKLDKKEDQNKAIIEKIKSDQDLMDALRAFVIKETEDSTDADAPTAEVSTK